MLNLPQVFLCSSVRESLIPGNLFSGTNAFGLSAGFLPLLIPFNSCVSRAEINLGEKIESGVCVGWGGGVMSSGGILLI